MAATSTDELKQLDALLSTGSQSWLLGAGVSLSAGLPLMGPLTDRVLSMSKTHKHKDVLKEAKSLLPPKATIEHILSHFADYLAIADRTTAKEVTIGKAKISCDELRKLLQEALSWIAETIRWGYVAADGAVAENIGVRGKSIVTIEAHQAFIRAIFDRGQAGLSERRGPVRFFTTNYDTLLEDALSLCSVQHWDGYTGGAVAFRSYQFGQGEPKPDSGYRAHVIKLHGSIDWYVSDDYQIYRVRDDDLFPKRGGGRVLIYPQATKYLATQRDPFAGQFDLFRRTLQAPSENVLAICGYSCGDDHINQEIELALQRPDNKTTIIVFAPSVSETLKKWQAMPWSKRLYLITEEGLFVGTAGPFAAPAAGKKHDWWKFKGAADLLSKGAEACIA